MQARDLTLKRQCFPRSRAATVLQDSPEGKLHLALELHSHWNWWHRVSNYLRTAIDQADQRHQLDDSMWRSVFAGP